ncbi:hypothetical protein GCM10027180_04370 [Microbulbifer echini]
MSAILSWQYALYTVNLSSPSERGEKNTITGTKAERVSHSDSVAWHCIQPVEISFDWSILKSVMGSF